MDFCLTLMHSSCAAMLGHFGFSNSAEHHLIRSLFIKIPALWKTVQAFWMNFDFLHTQKWEPSSFEMNVQFNDSTYPMQKQLLYAINIINDVHVSCSLDMNIWKS